MEKKNIPPEYGLRVGIKGMGCGGSTSYLLGFDKPKEKDKCYTIDSIPVYIEKGHMMYLIGQEIDYYEGSHATGFRFITPAQESNG